MGARWGVDGSAVAAARAFAPVAAGGGAGGRKPLTARRLTGRDCNAWRLRASGPWTADLPRQELGIGGIRQAGELGDGRHPSSFGRGQTSGKEGGLAGGSEVVPVVVWDVF